jgi:hypothetical protein
VNAAGGACVCACADAAGWVGGCWGMASPAFGGGGTGDCACWFGGVAVGTAPG